MFASVISLGLVLAAIQAVDAGHPAQHPAQRHAEMMRGKRAGAADGTHNNGANPCKRKETSSSHLESRSDSSLNIFSTSGRAAVDFVSNIASSSSSSGNVVSVASTSQNTEPLFKPIAPNAVKSPAAGFQVVQAPAVFTPSTGSALQVVHSWSGSDFLGWDYFHWDDPTHGSVNYVNLTTAQAQNLVGLQGNQFKMSLSTGAPVNGKRNSVRISSPASWSKGQLLVGDFGHIPEGCGTWPAFWTIGASRTWPSGGEIDIMEGVNGVGGNTLTLHTTAGCSATNSAGASTMLLTKDCQYQPGCSYKDTDPASFGPATNAAGGGVYAAFFDDSGIKIWTWKRSDVPASLNNGAPDLSTFGKPKASFDSSSCNMDQFFDKDQMIIINTTLMGDWAGATFHENGCTGSLTDAVANGNFNNAYWLINSVKVYQ